MFEPRVGKKYGMPDSHFGGKRILVVGESHYAEHPEQIGKSADVTTEIVEEYALRVKQRFFTGVTQVIGGTSKSSMSPDGILEIWDSIVFYNYIPVFVGMEPRVRPTNHMWKMGHEPFMEVLAKHKPEVVLVCGLGLWGWMFQGLYPNDLRPWTYPSSHVFNGMVFVQIMHPSATGFSWPEWHDRFSEGLKKSSAMSVKAH